MIRGLRFILQSASQVVYPVTCCVCDRDLVLGERHICSACAFDLPYITPNEQDVTKLSKLFRGRIDIDTIHSYLNYQKGNAVQSILHEIKYKGKPGLATYLGKLLAKTVPEKHPYSGIVPIPLHPRKQRQRGFNQSQAIADGMAEVLRVPVLNKCIRRKAYNESQTRFSKYDRYENVRSIFAVTRPGLIKDRHILLVDDVLTTGATIEACAAELITTAGCKVSIATLAARV